MHSEECTWKCIRLAGDWLMFRTPESEIHSYNPSPKYFLLLSHYLDVGRRQSNPSLHACAQLLMQAWFRICQNRSSAVPHQLALSYVTSPQQCRKLKSRCIWKPLRHTTLAPWPSAPQQLHVIQTRASVYNNTDQTTWLIPKQFPSNLLRSTMYIYRLLRLRFLSPMIDLPIWLIIWTQTGQFISLGLACTNEITCFEVQAFINLANLYASIAQTQRSSPITNRSWHIVESARFVPDSNLTTVWQGAGSVRMPRQSLLIRRLGHHSKHTNPQMNG